MNTKFCPFGFWDGIDECRDRLNCITSGEPNCKFLPSGITVKDYMRRFQDETN